MAIEKDKLIIEIEADPKGAAKGIDRLHKKIGQLQGRLDKLRKKELAMINETAKRAMAAKKAETAFIIKKEKEQLNAALEKARKLGLTQKSMGMTGTGRQFTRKSAQLTAGRINQGTFRGENALTIAKVNSAIAEQESLLKAKDAGEKRRIREKAAAERAAIQERVAAERRVAAFKKKLDGVRKRGQAATKRALNEEHKKQRQIEATERRRLQLMNQQNAKMGQQLTMQQSINAAVKQWVGIYAVFAAGRALFNTGQRIEGIKASLLIVSETSSGVAEDFKFIEKQSLRTGQNLKTMAEGFVKLGVAGKGKLDKATIKDVFVGFTELATATGADQMRAEKGLQAISQMMSKGQIMAEELRQQLGEQIPGSLQAMERAVKTVFGPDADMWGLMQQGKLLPETIFPEFANEMRSMANTGGALQKQMNSTRATFGRFKTAVTQLVTVAFEGGLGALFSSIFESLTAITQILSRTLIPLVSGFLAGLLVPFFKTISVILNSVNSLLEFIGEWVTKFGELFGVDNLSGKLLALVGILAGVAVAVSSLSMIVGMLADRWARVAAMAGMAAGSMRSASVAGMGSMTPSAAGGGRGRRFSSRAIGVAGAGTLLAGSAAAASMRDDIGRYDGLTGAGIGTALGGVIGSAGGVPGSIAGAYIGGILGQTAGEVFGSSVRENLNINVEVKGPKGFSAKAGVAD